ncbi:MAG: hypothetical protein M9894_01370 [Planctomycetes bacterium]|nr:hypothetical protein [Planctomycetota bacterium]
MFQRTFLCREAENVDDPVVSIAVHDGELAEACGSAPNPDQAQRLLDVVRDEVFRARLWQRQPLSDYIEAKLQEIPSSCPSYYAFLWVTCRLASRAEGNFYQVLTRWIRDKRECKEDVASGDLKNLPKLWTALVHCLDRLRRAPDRQHRPLVLPNVQLYRSHYSHSFWLAFPDDAERRAIDSEVERLLDRSDTGDDLPDGLLERLQRVPALARIREDFTRDGSTLQQAIAGCYRSARRQWLANRAQSNRLVIQRVVDALLRGGVDDPSLPIEPAIAVLERERDALPKEFRDDLDHLLTIGTRRERERLPVWRMLEEEFQRRLKPEQSSAPSRAALGLILLDDEDCPPRLMIATESLDVGSELTGYSARNLEPPIGALRHRWSPTSNGGRDIVREAFGDSRSTRARLANRRSIERGVLLFGSEWGDDRFTVLEGSDVEEADRAVVRADLLAAFHSQFGGSEVAIDLPGWAYIVGCGIAVGTSLPGALDGVHHLKRSAAPRVLGVSGGIRLGHGDYVPYRGFLPVVSASGANEVRLIPLGVSAGTPELQLRSRDDGRWEIPGESIDQLLKADSWQVECAPADEFLVRELRFRSCAVSCEYWSPTGNFYVEHDALQWFGMQRGTPLTRESGVPFLQLVCMPGAPNLQDIFAPSVFLGPAVGEVSEVARPGFDWRIGGSRRNPTSLHFEGAAACPTRPREEVSSAAKGERRPAGFLSASSERDIWMNAFRRGLPAFHQGRRIDEGASEDRVADALEAYRTVRARAVNRHLRATWPASATTTEGLRILTPSQCSAIGQSAVAAQPLNEVLEGLAALFATRAERRLAEVKALLRGAFERQWLDAKGSPDRVNWEDDVIRSWCEAGLLDLLIESGRGSVHVVARRARFVVHRRGERSWEATLLGLTGPDLLLRIASAIEDVQEVNSELCAGPATAWGPTTLRVQSDVDPSPLLEEVAQRLRCGLGPSEYLPIPQSLEIAPAWDCPGILKAMGTKSCSEPRHGSRLERIWSPDEGRFVRGRDTPDGIRIEHHYDEDIGATFVVRDRSGRNLGSTPLRNWALIRAASLQRESVFRPNMGFELRPGSVVRQGPTPVYMPIAIGRICVALGRFAAGPVALQPYSRVSSYEYPLGDRVIRWLSPALPPVFGASGAGRSDR